ncbi:MAG: hypothetical protein P8Q97_06125 [Myxococcota bacterium]|nr:hypothetical protein [Myxococcota bacterium]
MSGKSQEGRGFLGWAAAVGGLFLLVTGFVAVGLGSLWGEAAVEAADLSFFALLLGTGFPSYRFS